MDNAKLIDELVRDECRGGRPELKPYLDNAVPPRLTIGIGRNLTDRGISAGEAFYLVNNDIEGVLADLDQHIPWWRNLDDARQRVLANMGFNMGVRKLMKFTDTLALIKAGRYVAAAAEMLRSDWARQVGPRAKRLSDAMAEGGT